jgi:hypothetical protein
VKGNLIHMGGAPRLLICWVTFSPLRLPTALKTGQPPSSPPEAPPASLLAGFANWGSKLTG